MGLALSEPINQVTDRCLPRAESVKELRRLASATALKHRSWSEFGPQAIIYRYQYMSTGCANARGRYRVPSDLTHHIDFHPADRPWTRRHGVLSATLATRLSPWRPM